MIYSLKNSFFLSNLNDIFTACMNIILKLKTRLTEPKFVDIKYSLLVSAKEKFVSNKFIQAILNIELIEYDLKETDFQYLYNTLISSDELNDKDLKFLSYLELLISHPEYYREIDFHIHLDETSKNIYRIETHAIQFVFNPDTVKHSYNELLKDLGSITFMFNTIYHEQYKKMETFSDSFQTILRDYFNNLLCNFFEEGTHGNFVSEYERRNNKETIYFINR
jgi:hypothetical protein